MNQTGPRSLALLAITVFVAINIGLHAEEKEERFTSYVIPTPTTLSIRDVIRTRLLVNEQGHFEKGSSGAYERREVITTIEDRTRVGDRVTSVFPFGENAVRMPPQEFSLKLIPHGETLFAKIVAKFDPYGKDSGITIEQSGMYEMKVIEGSYEAFQAGGSITVEIKKDDFDRYLATATKSFQHPGFLTFCAEEFREQQVKALEKRLAESPDTVLPAGVGAGERERFLAHYRICRVQAIPTVVSKPTRFYFTGDTMRSESEEVGVEIKYVTSIPNANQPTAAAGDWMERYNVHKKSDFHAEDFDDTRVLDPREKLPGWYKPDWRQQTPVP